MKNIFTLIFLLFCRILSLGQTDPAHEKKINTIIFSNDSKFVITGSDDNCVRIWDTKTGNLLHSLKHSHPVKTVLISPDKNFLLTSSGTSNHCLWDIKAGQMLKCLADHDIMGFTADSKNVVVTSYSPQEKMTQIGLISLPEFERFYFSKKFDTSINPLFLAYSSDGDKIFVSNGGKLIYSLDKDKPEQSLKHKIRKLPGKLAFSPDDKLLVVQNLFELYDAQSWKPILQVKDSSYITHTDHLRFTSDGKYLLSFLNNKVNVLDTDSGKFLKTISMELEGAKIKVLSPDAKVIAYSREDNTLWLADVDSMQKQRSLIGSDFIEQNAFKNYLLAIHYYTEKKYTQSIKYFSSAEGKTARAPKLHLYRGKSYLNIGQYDKAIEDFNKDDSLAPKRSEMDLARAYFGKKDIDNALIHLQTNLISTYRERWTTIMKDSFVVMVKQDPRWLAFVKNNPISEGEKMINIAEERYKRGDKIGAMEYLNNAVKLEPTNFETYRARGLLHLNLNQYDNAISDFKKEAETNSEKLLESYETIAKIYSTKGEIWKAISILEECINSDPGNYIVLLDIAELEEGRYQRKNAVSAVDRYLEIIPNDHYAYYMRANYQENQKNKLEDITKAISLCQENGISIPQEYQEMAKSKN